MSDNLKDKQKRFCQEYIIDLNATKAAQRAGYSQKTAYSIGNELLKKPEIQDFITKKQLELQEATGITTKRVLEEYAKIAFYDIRKAYTVDGSLKSVNDFDDDTAAAVCGLETHEERVSDKDSDENVVVGTVKKVKLNDKLKALDSLGRHLGIFEKDNKQREIAAPTINILPPNAD